MQKTSGWSENTIIKTTNGYKCIKDIKNDSVFDGKWYKTVKSPQKFSYNGELIRFQCYGNNLRFWASQNQTLPIIQENTVLDVAAEDIITSDSLFLPIFPLDMVDLEEINGVIINDAFLFHYGDQITRNCKDRSNKFCKKTHIKFLNTKLKIFTKDRHINSRLWDRLSIWQKVTLFEKFMVGNTEDSFVSFFDKHLAFQFYDVLYSLDKLPSIVEMVDYYVVSWRENRINQKHGVRKIDGGYASRIIKIEKKAEKCVLYKLDLDRYLVGGFLTNSG